MNNNMDAIRARCAAITPGEWWNRRDYVVICDGEYDWSFTLDTPEGVQDAEFIANAPVDIRALLAQHDADQGRIKVLEAKLRDISEHAIIENPETPFERGYNDGTFMARQIALDALKGGE